MKVFEKINCSHYEDKISLQKVIKDLLPLRKDRKRTRDYCNDYLKSDMRLKEFKEDRYEAEINHCLEKNPDLKEFTLKDGEIEPGEAMAFRSVLLEIIEDDKESFGYLYWVLASEVNRQNGVVLYPCVIPKEEIEYNIDFDIDELKAEIKAENDLKNKLKLVQEKLSDSNKDVYQGEKKVLFEEFCKAQIQAIEDEVKIFGYQPQQKEQNTINNTVINLPKELETDEAKQIFAKAIKEGLMVNTETGCYHWKKSTALLAYFCDVVSEKLNLRASNNKIRWALFKPLFGIDKSNNSLRDAVNEYKNKTGQNPDGYKIIDSLF